MMGVGREPSTKEISGSLACDGYASSLSSLFGVLPVTSFSQNVGLVAMTKVVNRFTIATGGLALVLAGLFPPIGAFFNTLPQPVLGGCTVIMFGQIIISGIGMLGRAGLNQRNSLIAALALSIGLGFTTLPGLFNIFPQLVAEELATEYVEKELIKKEDFDAKVESLIKLDAVGIEEAKELIAKFSKPASKKEKVQKFNNFSDPMAEKEEVEFEKLSHRDKMQRIVHEIFAYDRTYTPTPEVFENVSYMGFNEHEERANKRQVI